MLLEPIDTRPITLANHLIKFLSHFHPVAYALLRADLTVSQVSGNFGAVLSDFLNSPVVENRYLPDLVWEFVGQEEAITLLLQGKLPMLTLELVNRPGKNGSLNYLNFYLTAILGEQELDNCLLLLVEDVTATARIEQQLLQERNELRLIFGHLNQAHEKMEQLNRQKSLLLTFATHELRTPLTVIDGYGQMLLRELESVVTAPQRQLLENLNQQINHLHLLLDALLDIDKLEQGRIDLSLSLEVLTDLVRDVVQSLQPVAQRNEILLTASIPAGPIMIMGDALRLRQLFYNLIWNAFKYTGREGEVQVRLHRQENRARFQVTDTGRGIPPEQLERIFQLHYRVTETSQEGISGSGIGLYLVKNWVEAHHGRMEVESVHGQGSTFSVWLPIQNYS